MVKVVKTVKKDDEQEQEQGPIADINQPSVPEGPTLEFDVPLPSGGGSGITANLRKLAEAPIGASIMLPNADGQRVRVTGYQLGGGGWFVTRSIYSEADENGFKRWVGTRVWKTAEPTKLHVSNGRRGRPPGTTA